MISYPRPGLGLLILAVGGRFGGGLIGVHAVLAYLCGGDAAVPAVGQLLEGLLLLRRAGEAAQGGLRVLRAVAVGVRERAHAVVDRAVERLFPGVQPLMRLELARLGEATGAPWVIARIGLLTFNGKIHIIAR